MDGPGTITWEEFVENAETFVRLSDAISDSWELRGEKLIPGEAYLCRQVKTFVPNNYLADDGKIMNKEACKNEDEEIDGCGINDPFEANSESEQPFVIEHHILWSMSYGVPVLYFNAWFSDFSGVNPVSVERAQRLATHDDLAYAELSQAIHPILGTTFLQLHPCKSEELLRNTCKSNNKLVSWLSAVGPAALNLKLSLKYCELTRRKDEMLDETSPNDVGLKERRKCKEDTEPIIFSLYGPQLNLQLSLKYCELTRRTEDLFAETSPNDVIDVGLRVGE